MSISTSTAIETLKGFLLVLKKLKYEYIFILIAFPWGIIQSLLMPPFQSPDEPTHFYRAWGLSSLQIACDEKYQVILPVNVVQLPAVFDVRKIDSGFFPTINLKREFSQKIDSEKEAVYSYACPYNPLGYVPQSIGIGLARILEFSPISTYYLGRFANLTFSIAILFFAIRITPVGKPLFVFFSVLPMSIHQFASFSNDGATISGLLLFLAIILHASQKRFLDKTVLMRTAFGAIFLTQVKPGYVGFFPLLFLIQAKQFKSKIKYVMFIATTIFVGVSITFLINKLNNPEYLLKPSGNYVVNYSEQIQFIKSNPIAYLGILLDEFKSNYIIYIYEIIGLQGWMTLWFPATFYTITVIALITLLTVKDDAEEFCLRPYQRLILASIFFIEIFIIATTLYIVWNEPKSSHLVGLQGRYLIAPTLVLAASLYGITRLKSNALLKGLFLIFFISVAVYSLQLVYTHYYKDYLFVFPDTKAADFSPLTQSSTQLKDLSIVENTDLKSTSTDSYMILPITRDTLGISWISTAHGNAHLYYSPKKDAHFTEKLSDALYPVNNNQFIVNIGHLEKSLGKNIKFIRIDFTDQEENFSLSNIKIYSR